MTSLPPTAGRETGGPATGLRGQGWGQGRGQHHSSAGLSFLSADRAVWPHQENPWDREYFYQNKARPKSHQRVQVPDMQCDLGSKYKRLCFSKLMREGAGTCFTSMDTAEDFQVKSLNRAQDESKDFQLQAEATKMAIT